MSQKRPRPAKEEEEEEEEEEEGQVRLTKVLVPGGEEEEDEEAANQPKVFLKAKTTTPSSTATTVAAYATGGGGEMIEILLNDRLGKKLKIKCNSDDTVGDLKKLVALQTGTRAEKIRIQKWYTVFKDHIQLQDYEVKHGMSLELYYN